MPTDTRTKPVTAASMTNVQDEHSSIFQQFAFAMDPFMRIGLHVDHRAGVFLLPTLATFSSAIHRARRGTPSRAVVIFSVGVRVVYAVLHTLRWPDTAQLPRAHAVGLACSHM